jgi:hypothetical protein
MEVTSRRTCTRIDTFRAVPENSSIGALCAATAGRYAVQGPVWQTSSAWMMSPTS